jgi:hypothetical protein
MGGRELGPVFNRYLETMEYGLDVVEVGAWLGAGTYELATAIREHGHDETTLHVYDRFEADKSQVIKAAGRNRYPAGIRLDNQGAVIKLREKENTLPKVKKFLADFPFIRFYKGEIGNLKYTGKGIGVLVIDTMKRDPQFTALMKKLEPRLASGATVFFMDYFYHQKVKGVGTECQERYTAKSGKYKLLEHPANLSCAVMRYEVT